ncbi:MAG: hypothetical protein QG567_1268 [Campylobacterota bacterium]|nr:hypothetical protein [Campylobacterota bacterium]
MPIDAKSLKIESIIILNRFFTITTDDNSRGCNQC